LAKEIRERTMNVTKNILGVIALVNGLLIANAADAATWLNIGKYDGYTYYIDKDNQTSKGSVWKAPIKEIGKGETYFGELYIDCSDYTARVILSDYEDDWYNIEANTPEDFAAQQICG